MRDKITKKTFEPGTLTLNTEHDESVQGSAYAGHAGKSPFGKLAYIETYGCQMNFSDTEIVASVLSDLNYTFTPNAEEADLVLLNTCSIRENAEDKVWNRLTHLKGNKARNPDLMVGVLGCMAERMKKKLLDESQLVDLVVGPDAYRDLGRLIGEVESGQRAVNVLLSREETYADLAPVRLNTNGVSAFVTIMRGCDNMCTFCVVPFTRGRERSRNYHSIVEECRDLYEAGYREVTLLGQNVDSYKWAAEDGTDACNFAQLLEHVALIHPDLRVRFSTSHPKDITDEVMFTMAKYDNICQYIHLPVQSGNSRVLELMNRGYTREWYMQKVDRIREIMPDCAISSDIITGFCTETEEDHRDTLSLMAYAGFSYSFTFAYSERPGTPAAKRMTDDVPEEVKKRRLQEIIEVQNRLSLVHNQAEIGKERLVLIESNSKRSDADWCGRSDQNKMVVFPKSGDHKPGDYVRVRITEASSATLKGEMV